MLRNTGPGQGRDVKQRKTSTNAHHSNAERTTPSPINPLNQLDCWRLLHTKLNIHHEGSTTRKEGCFLLSLFQLHILSQPPPLCLAPSKPAISTPFEEDRGKRIHPSIFSSCPRCSEYTTKGPSQLCAKGGAPTPNTTFYRSLHLHRSPHHRSPLLVPCI